jgi:hypothetical protein
MWKVSPSEEIEEIVNGLDAFVEDVFDWCRKNPKEYSTEELVKANISSHTKLKKIVSSTEVGKYIAKLVETDKKEPYYAEFRRTTNNYLSILDGDHTVEVLEGEDVKFLRQIFDYFYDNIFKSAILQKHYLVEKEYKHNNIKDNFREMSLKINNVCPYCDARRFDHTAAITIDHFLPRDKYPYLAIYSKNLVACCSLCNSAFKNNSMSFPIFHPHYHQPADSLKFKFKLNDDIFCEEIGIDILEEYEKEIKRVGNYIELIKLKQVYSNLNNEINSEIRKIKRNAMNRYTGDINLALNSYIEELKDDVSDNIGYKPFRKLKMDFYDYIKNFQPLIDYFSFNSKGK